MEKKNDKKICFVISPIGEVNSETRKCSDTVLRHIITPSVEAMGYDPIRADNIPESGIITTQIIQHIVEAHLVIADLTERNPNVFYELAIRHATRKPLIQMIKKGENIPFDVAATRIIHFDLVDLDSVAQAKDEITNQIKAIESGKGETDNPISVSLDLKILRESGNPEQRSFADMLGALTELRGMIISIDKRINAPEGLLPIDIIDKIYGRAKNRTPPDFIFGNNEFRELRFEIMEVNERLQKFISNAQLIEKDMAELQNIIVRIDMIAMRFFDTIKIRNRLSAITQL